MRRIRFAYLFLLTLTRRNLKPVLRVILVLFAFGLILNFTFGSFWKPITQRVFANVNKPTYSEAIVGSVSSLNPLFEKTEAEKELNKLVFRGLTKTDESGQIVPDLAESFQSVSPTEYIFKLKRNIDWHDGQPFTADDVVYTVEASQDPSLETTSKAVFKDVQIDKLDDHSVRFRLKETFAPFLEQTSFGILPEHIPLDQYRPVGTGNFQVASFNKGKVVLANEKINLVFRLYPTKEQAILGLKQGEVKALGGLSSSELKEFEKYQNYNVKSETMPTRLVAIFFNTKADAVSEKLVRQALALNTDKQSLLKAVDPDSLIAKGPLAAKNTLGLENKEYFSLDSAKAATLLENAGWKLESGKRTKDGKRLSITLTTLASDQFRQLAEQIGKSWTALGIDYQIISLEPEELTQAVQNTQYQVILTSDGYRDFTRAG